MNSGHSESNQYLYEEDQDLLACLLEQEERMSAERFRIPSVAERDGYPLSSGQLRLRFFEQMKPGNPAYHFSFRLRFEGAFDETAASANACLDAMAARADFLDLRDHSLPATQVNAYTRSELEVDLNPEQEFERPAVSELEEKIGSPDSPKRGIGDIEEPIHRIDELTPEGNLALFEQARCARGDS